MADERVDFVITADVDGLNVDLKRGARAFDDLGEAAVGSAGKMRRADKAASKMGREARDSTDKLEGLKFAAQGAGGRIGEMAGRVENAGRAFKLLGGPGGAALVATAAIAGVTIAATAAVAGMVKLTRASREYIKEAEEMEGVGFGEEQVARIEAANVALDAAVFALKGFGVELASNFAPTVSFIATATTAATLATQDYFTAWADGESIATSAINSIGRSFKPLVDAQAGFLSVVLAARELVEGTDNPLNPSEERQSGLRTLIRSYNSLSESLEDAAESSATIVEVGLGDYWAEAQAATEGYAAALQTTAIQQSAVAGQIKTELSEFNKEAAQSAALLQAAKAGGKDDLGIDKSLAIAAQESQALKNAQDGTNSSLGTSIDLATSLFTVIGRGAAEQQKNAKAVALGNIAIDTAAGLVKSIATLGPPVPPNVPGIIGAATVAATGVASAAKVNQSFDIGGVVQPGRRFPGGTPGQVQVQAEVGEVFFSQGQLDALGGAMGGGGSTTVNLVVGNRTTEAIVVQNQRAGGSLSRMRTPRATSQQRYSR